MTLRRWRSDTDHADALAGGKRHLAQFPAFGGERFYAGRGYWRVVVPIAARWDKGIGATSRRSAVLWHRYASWRILHRTVFRIVRISAVHICAQAGIDMNDMWLTSSRTVVASASSSWRTFIVRRRDGSRMPAAGGKSRGSWSRAQRHRFNGDWVKIWRWKMSDPLATRSVRSTPTMK